MDDGPTPVVIVFDGPASAGKTSNLRRISESIPAETRSELVSPEEKDGETQHFDWLHVDATDSTDETTTSALLLAVPGHGTYRSRRQALLALADVVVFVVDSTPHRLRWAAPMFRELPTRFGAATEQRVIVQANKQDLDDALAPDEVAESFAKLAPPVPVLGACAKTGAGVADTLATAIETAVRFRKTGPRASPSPRTPEELMQYLAATTQKMEDRSKTLVPVGPGASPPPSTAGQPRPLRRPSSTAITPLFPPRSEVPPEGDERPTEPMRTYSGEVPVNFALPNGTEPTPHLWPAVKARQWLKNLEQPLHFVKLSSGDIEGLTDEARFRTREDWRYDDLRGAKLALRARAQTAVALGDRGPAREALVIVDDGERGHRMWLISPASESPMDRLQDAERRHDAMASAGLLVQLVGALVDADRLAVQAELTIDPDISNYAMDDRKLRYVGTVAVGGEAPPSLVDAARKTFAMLSPTLQPQWLDALAGAFASLTGERRKRIGIETATPDRDAIYAWLHADSAQDAG